ncbi:hypothetical protein BC567DRAFT_225707 [Phyllosticta citribraziliensis]
MISEMLPIYPPKYLGRASVLTISREIARASERPQRRATVKREAQQRQPTPRQLARPLKPREPPSCLRPPSTTHQTHRLFTTPVYPAHPIPSVHCFLHPHSSAPAPRAQTSK